MDNSEPRPDAGRDESSAERAVNPDRVGIPMHLLDRIIRDLDNRVELQAIFGVPVSRALAIVADDSALRIEEAGAVKLSAEDRETFTRILGEVIEANAT